MLQVTPLPAIARQSSFRVTTISAVVFGRVGFALMWTSILGLHAVSAAYFIAAGQVYASLPSTLVSRVLTQYQLTLNLSYFPILAHVHYVLAGVHVCFFIKPFAAMFLPTPRFTDSVASFTVANWRMAPRSTIKPQVRTCRVFVRQLITRLKQVYRLLLARDGVFGVHNQYFELYFLSREVIETVLQTYQAYMMSHSLPRVNLNGFYTAMIIMNCWTTPLLKRVSHGNKPLERLLVVLCDIVLDFVSSIGVPVVIVIGYLKLYDPVQTDFVPWTLYYDDVWFLNFVNEAQIVLLGSGFDVISRLVFSFGLLSSLEDVKSLVKKRRPTAPVVIDSISNATSASCRQGRRSSVKEDPKAPVRVVRQLQRPEVQETISKWVHWGMVLWGLGVALIALQAYVRARPSHCALELRPWLATGPACAIVTMDCVKEPDFTGIAADFDAVFRDLDVVFVEQVIVHHCAHAEISPVLLSFRNLFGVRTYNTTIQIWSRDAALTATAHPRVRFAIFVRTDFMDATLPTGLHHEDAPMTLTDLEIVVSNIDHLPPALPWPPGMLICFEYTQFDELPSVIEQLQPNLLSVGFNRITVFPVNVLESPTIVALYLLGNPIPSLPDTGVDVTPPNLMLISLEHTGISSLPAWVTEEFVSQVEIYMAQTPLCVNVLQNETSAERDRLLRDRPWLVKVEANCVIEFGSCYPLGVDAT